MISRINNLLKTKGISKAKLARSINVLPQTLGNWMARGRIPNNMIVKVADTLEVSNDHLLTGIMDHSENTVTFKVLNIEVSAGTGLALFNDPESVVQSISIDRDKFYRLFQCQPKDTMRIINIKGTSMSPTFKDKDFVLCDTDNTDLVDGVFVFRTQENELYIKRLQRTPDGIIAISDNPMFKDFDLPKTADIVARVICVWQYNQL